MEQQLRDFVDVVGFAFVLTWVTPSGTKLPGRVLTGDTNLQERLLP